MVFPVVMYGCEIWTIKKAEHWRIDAFELWCWRKLLRVPWTERRYNQSILKDFSPDYSLEGLMLKLNLQYFGTWCEELTHLKRPWCWERLKAEGDREGRGWDGWMASRTWWTWVWVSPGSWWWTGKPSGGPWGHKELAMIDWLNWTERHTISLQKKDGYSVWNWDVQSYVSPGYKIYPSLCGVQVQDFFSESELYVLRGWWT